MNSINVAKIKIKSMGNQDSYNHVTLEKSELFLDNLQDFVIDVGIAKIHPNNPYEYEGKSYDMHTYHSLFDECHSIDDSEPRKRKIADFKDGYIIRYFDKEIEMLIIFFENKIELIFYCDLNIRKKIMDSLLKFCEIEKVKSK